MEPTIANSVPQDAAKAVQEKQLLLSRLLARLAHEIRNPLSSLDIHVQLLEEDVTHAAPEVKERSAARFKIIRTEIDRLNNLVKQFVGLAGRSAVTLQTVSIAHIAEHVCALLRPQAAVHGITIELSVPADLPPVAADPDQLTQALLNLVLNAVQAVSRNGTVSVAALVLQDRRTEITVKDTGPGIDPKHLDALFEPFFTTKDDGSGLGLWIVRQIAVAHGGTIAAANGPRGGAVFTLTLPLHGEHHG